MNSATSRRLARLEAARGDGDFLAYARRPVAECPDWVLLSVLTGRRITPAEARASQDCPTLDAEIAAYLRKVRAGAHGAVVEPADFALSLGWLEARQRAGMAAR